MPILCRPAESTGADPRGLSSNRYGSAASSIPAPSSSTANFARPAALVTFTVILVVVLPCAAAFSSRFVSTWQMSTASIGTNSTSSGICVSTRTSGRSFLNFPTASATTSSTASGDFCICAPSPPTRVIDSRFSTILMSHSESSFTSASSSRRLSSGSSGLSSITDAAPAIEVSGVRRSCDTERSRSARILARSPSILSRSCCFTFVVSALVLIDTVSMVTKVSG